MKSLRKIMLAGTPFYVALVAVLSATMLAPAHANTPESLSQVVAQYVEMCANQATNIPAPHGEGDLRGNPKLGEYCQCFGEKFAAQALAAAQGGSKPPSLDKMVEQEQNMRNSCRQQVGLPLLNF